MTHCRECGTELTDEEQKYYTCYCKKCEKKLRGELERDIEEAWKHLESLLDNTENVLNFESKVRKTSGSFSKMIEI